MKILLKNRSGSGFPLIVAVVLALLILSCAVYEFLRLSIIASGVRDAVQSAIISVATENYSNVYPSLRQSYSGGYIRSSAGWAIKVSTGDIYTRLVKALGLVQEGNQYEKRTGGEVEYTISNLKVTIQNPSFAPASTESIQQFTVQAVIHLEVPLSFGWERLPSMKADLPIQAVYRPKFSK
ncbi:hypothetical protein MHH49_18080 [Paenibacillus sp. FSL F4-0122]|uniref:hypothetical protein n=1 Tax=Paenibacillus sp. FSL F4-0122 TaxID=2921371 RepID=UPI0030FBA893